MSEYTFRNGHYYNKFGSIVYPRKKNINKSIRSFQEFEIQAIAYSKLRDFFKNDKFIRGEFSIRSNKDNYCYLRCDIAILNKDLQPILIIEVKRNYQETLISQGQIELYKKHAPVFVLSNMPDAENIVQVLMTKNLISLDLLKSLEPTKWES